jgi:hypothetical protein
MSLSAKPKGRFHNPKVGGSIPPPATNFLFIINNLQGLAGSHPNSGVSTLCPEQTAPNSKKQ